MRNANTAPTPMQPKRKLPVIAAVAAQQRSSPGGDATATSPDAHRDYEYDISYNDNSKDNYTRLTAQLGYLVRCGRSDIAFVVRYLQHLINWHDQDHSTVTEARSALPQGHQALQASSGRPLKRERDHYGTLRLGLGGRRR